MTDPISTSKSARESLARGLNALQADPSVPPQLLDLAQPIAQAMGALHQIEKTSQLSPHADVALNHLRGALSSLQAVPASHPAVNAALEAVASSLGLVHQLGKMANGPVAQPAPAPPPAPAPTPQQVQQAKGQTAAIPQRAPVAPGSQPAFPQQAAPQQQQNFQPPPQQMQPQNQGHPRAPFNPPPPGPAPQPMQQPPMAQADPFAAPRPTPAVVNAPTQGVPVGPPATPSMPVPAPPAGNLQIVNADLGAHSPTNFFKGLSGNDIIDHGGLFVSTYVPPKPGTKVRLKVSLPGGYEFEANALVKWVREQGGDAPPGFGAQFIEITNEARQLVYRYVRNREPLFHDDL